MQIKHEWYLEPHIMHAHVPEELSLDELMAFSDMMIARMDSEQLQGVKKLHLLLDETQAKAYPKRIQDFAKAVLFARHEKMGFVFSYGQTHPLINFMSKTVAGMTGMQYRSVPDIETALKQLSAVDLAIPWQE